MREEKRPEKTLVCILCEVHKPPIFKLAPSTLSLHSPMAEADGSGIIITKLVAGCLPVKLFPYKI